MTHFDHFLVLRCPTATLSSSLWSRQTLCLIGLRPRIARCGHDQLRGATLTSFVSVHAVASRWSPRGVPAQPSRVPNGMFFTSVQTTTRCGAMRHEAEAQDTVSAATRARTRVAVGLESDRGGSKYWLWLVKYCLAPTQADHEPLPPKLQRS